MTKILITALLVTVLTMAEKVSAVSHTGGVNDGSGGGGGSTSIVNPLQANSIVELFTSLIEIVMVFAIPIIVFFIVYAGFLYVTARGSVDKIQTAHKALLYALIGALLIIGANVLITVISGTVDSITA